MNLDISNYWPFVTVLFAGGFGVTLVAQVLKKLFKADAAHVIHLMVLAVSVVAAAAQYVLQFKGKVPTGVLGVSTPVIYGVSQFVYKESRYVNAFLSRVYNQAPVPPSTTMADAEVAKVDATAAKAASETPSAEFSV